MPSPTSIPTVPTLWDHLVAISRPRFFKKPKRKVDAPQPPSFQIPKLQKTPYMLCQSLKMLKLDEDALMPAPSLLNRENLRSYSSLGLPYRTPC